MGIARWQRSDIKFLVAMRYLQNADGLGSMVVAGRN
jgi:hypothetical protein